MTNTTYNGWTNYETWNFNLWYSENLQMDYEEQLEELKDSDDEMNDYATYNLAYNIVESFINMLIEELPEDIGFTVDVVSNAFSKINIDEITESLRE